MHSFDLLKLLGIPRWRVFGLSIFNFIGTFLLAALFVEYLPWFQSFTWYNLGFLFIPLAVVTHTAIGDHTPLVRLVKAKTCWRYLMLSLALAGWTGSVYMQIILAVHLVYIVYTSQ